MKDEFAKDREVCRAATEGPWEVATSCSYRRIVTAKYCGKVVEPITQRSDGHPDLSAKTEDLEFIVAARDRWPAALDEIKRLGSRERELEALSETVRSIVDSADNLIGNARSVSDYIAAIRVWQHDLRTALGRAGA